MSGPLAVKYGEAQISAYIEADSTRHIEMLVGISLKR